MLKKVLSVSAAVNTVTRSSVIIAGHTRFKALKKLGYERVNCVIADIDERKAKEYRIADNKSGELASWDDEKLLKELREIELPNLEIFFPETDLSEIIKQSTGTIRWEDVRQDDFEQAMAGEHQKIALLSEKREDQVKTVVCPSCGDEFQVI